MNENLGQGEVLSPKERGELAYKTAEELADRIYQLNEFREALAKKFFTRATQGEKNGIEHGVFFMMGSDSYRIEFPSHTGYHQDDERTIRMELTKCSPGGSRYARLSLSSNFIEDKIGNKKFQEGKVNLYLQLRPQSSPDKTNQDAVDAIPTCFSDIFHEPIKL